MALGQTAPSEELRDHKNQKGEEASESESSFRGIGWKKPSQSSNCTFLSTGALLGPHTVVTDTRTP